MFVCMHYCTHNVMRFFKNILLYEHSIRVDKLFKALKVNYFAKLACSICNHIFLLILYMHVTQFAITLYKSVLLTNVNDQYDIHLDLLNTNKINTKIYVHILYQLC